MYSKFIDASYTIILQLNTASFFVNDQIYKLAITQMAMNRYISNNFFFQYINTY